MVVTLTGDMQLRRVTKASALVTRRLELRTAATHHLINCRQDFKRAAL